MPRYAVHHVQKGDKTDIGNYRPLTMTETIYKLITGVINNRLVHPFNEIIGRAQAGFLPGRVAYYNIKEMQTMIDESLEEHRPLYVALLDQEKTRVQLPAVS